MEVQNMGLGWLQYVPEWAVNQDMMIALASSYSRDEKSLVVETRKIPILVESIARCFGLPNHGNSFKSPETAAEHRLVNSFTGKKQVDLKRDVITCLMQSDVDRINFRRQFIMLIAKCFFFPSPKATVSDIHIQAAIDVSNPRKMYWARYIYDFLIEEVLRFQEVGKKTVDGWMFALLGLLNLIGKMSRSPKKHNRVSKRGCIKKKIKSNRRTCKEAPTVDENETDISAGHALLAEFDQQPSKKGNSMIY
ncbi:uncharacterized protein DS421_17g591710 [Arachis hypogaea]|nr:uncharacterized protein DS421_17g591710 [Arachis hypogaea]